jgi:3-isopropylmalate/(R)-2-methylmalate dehydratase large subunit
MTALPAAIPGFIMTTPRSLLDKIWDQHVVTERGGEALLYIDRNIVHEGSFHAFSALSKEGRKVRKPRQNFATADHYVPTVGRHLGIDAIVDPEIRTMIELLEASARDNALLHLGMNDPRQGIVHVIGPELGITQPGRAVIRTHPRTALSVRLRSASGPRN